MQPLIYDVYTNYLKGYNKFLVRDLGRIKKESLNNYEIVWYNTIINYLSCKSDKGRKNG